jgi:hypothetical protein
MLDDIDLRMMGTPSIDQYASAAANSCGKLIDQIIIEGVGGPSFSEAANGFVNLPDVNRDITTATDVPGAYDNTSQVVPWADYRMGDNKAGTASLSVKAGLNSAKISQAVKKLRAKFNDGPIVCIASEYAMMTLRADPKCSNFMFSPQRTLADGFISSWGGVDAFIACQLVEDGKISHLGKNGQAYANPPDNQKVAVEYAYLYAVDQIKLGVGAPLYLKNGLNAERYLNNVLIYQGAYDCTRMFEESVVRIEIAKSAPTDAIAPFNYADPA